MMVSELSFDCLTIYFVKCGEPLSAARHKVIRLTKSSFVSISSAFAFNNTMKKGFVEFYDDE